jgi:hypothetical protein
LNLRALHRIAMATREFSSALPISIFFSFCFGLYVAGAVALFSGALLTVCSTVCGVIIIVVRIVFTLSFGCSLVLLSCLFCQWRC